jgi:hypothetical protein
MRLLSPFIRIISAVLTSSIYSGHMVSKILSSTWIKKINNPATGYLFLNVFPDRYKIDDEANKNPIMIIPSKNGSLVKY